MYLYLDIDYFCQIQFMLLNNKAHKLYLNNEIKYDYIINFIFDNLSLNNEKFDLSSFKKIVNYIEYQKEKYENL